MGPTAVLRAAWGAGRQLRLSRPERHRRAHPALGPRAQPADEVACPGVDKTASRDHRRGNPSADRGGRHDEKRDHTAAATSCRRQPLSLCVRVGGGGGRPRLDYDWSTREDPRIGISEKREATSRELAPELFSIHPMYAREPEEEIVFLSDAFLSHVPESGAHVPGYRSWIDGQDFTPAYSYLHRMLQFLQWQKRRSGLTAGRWVLKSPAHLGYLDTLRAQFPDLHVVHMHRDPVDTIPSGASLNATLHAMHSDGVDKHRVGAEWLQRMGWTNDRAMETRNAWTDETTRCTDIEFADAVADPIGQVARVYDAVGVALTSEAESAMRRWLVGASARAGPSGLRGQRFRAERRPDRRAVCGLQLLDSAPVQPPRGGSDVRIHRRSRSDGVATRTGARRARTHPSPDGAGGVSQRRRDVAGASEGVQRDARTIRRRLRRGDVLGGGVVVEPGQAAAEGQLHHPDRAPCRRSHNSRITLGHRQSRQRVPRDSDLGRRTI